MPLHRLLPDKARMGVFLALLLCAPVAHAQQQVKIFISSGTGFFVNRDGYILTNLHVVQHCERIIVSGAIKARLAQVFARNSDHDLALLKTDSLSTDVGEFRSDREILQVGDRVITVGYPGESFKTGQLVTREAQIVSTTGPKGEGKWLQLSDVVEQGNSGGPLLDTSGNVVGVVAAKALIYTYRSDEPQNGTSSQSGIAISQPAVLDFLDQHQVRYRTNDSGVYLSADRITDTARRFIVNVRCEYRTELR